MAELLNDTPLPRMPASLSQEGREGWMRGWYYESLYFDREDPLFPPAMLPSSVKTRRTYVLQDLIGFHTPDLETVEQQAAAVDRVLLGSNLGPEQWLSTVDSVAQDLWSGKPMIKEDFNTPGTWLNGYVNQLPEELLSDLVGADDILMAVALDGRVADYRPSAVAAAVLTVLLGVDRAEPYLCGYTVADISAIIDHVEDIKFEWT